MAAGEPGVSDAHRDMWFTTSDGVRLFARDYGSRAWTTTPVLCLAGLTRNSADFDALARHLSTRERPRRVVAIDMRGRGRSENDPSGTYELAREAADALDGAVAAGLHDFALVGTSRGAILAMAIGAIRPGVMRAVVMNDLGPVIDGQGLVQIKAYLSRLASVRSWDEAPALTKRLFERSFPDLTDEQWHVFGRAIFRERNGRIEFAHDPAIHGTLDAVDETTPPPMWTAFEGLHNVPVLSVRGELSTLFSAETQAEMARRHPRLETLVVPRQGHAPLLADAPTMSAIADFLERLDDQTRAATNERMSTSAASSAASSAAR